MPRRCPDGPAGLLECKTSEHQLNRSVEIREKKQEKSRTITGNGLGHEMS